MRQADKFTDFADLAATVVADWPDFNICPVLHTDKVALINKKLLPMKVGANYSFSCFGSFNHGRVRKPSFGSIASLPFLASLDIIVSKNSKLFLMLCKASARIRFRLSSSHSRPHSSSLSLRNASPPGCSLLGNPVRYFRRLWKRHLDPSTSVAT
jgi:hypothetical protein